MHLKRALGRIRMRFYRARLRMPETKYQDSKPAPKTAIITFDDRLEAKQLKEVVAVIENFIGIAFNTLNDRDYMLLFEAYGLEGFDIKPGQHVAPEELSPGAKKVALCRARKSFRKNLEALLVKRSMSLKKEQTLVDEALRLLRSGHITETLGRFED